MDWRERIVVDPTVLVGKPVIKGTRLAVEFVVDLLGRGWTDSTLRQHSTNTPQAGYGGDRSLYGRSAEKPVFPGVSGIVAVAGDSG